MTEESIFAAAIAIPDAPARAAYLDQACAGSGDLRQRLDALVAAHFASDPVLDPATAAFPDASLTHTAGDGTHSRPSAVEAVGTVIAGRYKLRQQIGEGGMGTVWMADQTEPVKRKVAVKLIRAERGSSAAILARFAAERQAIALMDHPHIAKLLDAGTEGGAPFFVMELVKGVPLTEFCDAHRLTVPDRLTLFTQICGAVQHAHQKGVIHRDLKPSNILVESHDGKPVPKVIDFGLAKATSGLQLTENTLFTGFGAVLGTPQYMAPEQAASNAVDVDTRADVYALGVILYELLTGTTPLTRESVRKAAVDEMLRLVREQEAVTPSSRLSSSESKPTVAANRQTEPAKLGRFVRGELDWIVLKALSKDRDRRYETANGFARDVERFLNHEPVTAGPVSAGYRLRKFVQRNKGPVLAAGLVFGTLVAGVVGTTVGLLEAKRQEGFARDEAAAKEIALKSEQAQRDKAEKARDRTRDVLDAMISGVTGDSLATQKVITDEQKKFLTEVLTYYKEFSGEKSDDEHARKRTALAAARVALIEFRLGHLEDSVTATRMARDFYTALAADFPTAPVYRSEVSGSQSNLGILLYNLGRRAEAEVELRKSVSILEQLTAEFPAVAAYRQYSADAHNNLGNLLTERAQFALAEDEFRYALVLREKLATDFPAVAMYRQDLAGGHFNIGNLLKDLRKWDKAEDAYRVALALNVKLAADFPAVVAYRHDLSQVHTNLGSLLKQVGKRPESETEFRNAVTIQEALVADFPAVPVYRRELARSYSNLGTLLAGLGQWAEAEVEYRKALPIRAKLVADAPGVPEHRSDLALSHQNLGALLKLLGKRAESEVEHLKALAIFEKLASDFPTTPAYGRELANHCYNLARHFATTSGTVVDRKAEYADRAVELLQKAVKAGWKDAARVKQDKTLDPLRGREDFQKLLADLEAKFPPKREVLPPPRKEKE